MTDDIILDTLTDILTERARKKYCTVQLPGCLILSEPGHEYCAECAKQLGERLYVPAPKHV